MSTLMPDAGDPSEAVPIGAELFLCHPMPSLLLDAQGRIALANPAANALLAAACAPGVAVADALGLPATGHAALQGLLRAPAGPVDLDRGAAASPRWLRADARLLPGPRVLLVVQDVDAEKGLQQEAARLDEYLGLVQQFGRLGVWERDLQTQQGKWDRHMHRFWGLDDNGPTPDRGTAALAVVEEDRDGVDAAFQRSLRQGVPGSHRYRVRGHDGLLRQLHSQWVVRAGPDGRPARAVGVIVDDTQSVALARSRDELMSQMALAIDLSGIVVWRHDLASDRVTFQGHGAEVLGIPNGRNDLPISEARAGLWPQDLPLALASAEQALRTGQPSDAELHYTAVDGSVRTVLMRRVVQADERGVPKAFLGVALDMTERVAASQRTAELARRLELATQAAGVGYWSLEGDAKRATWSEQLRAMHGLPAGAEVPTLGEWLDHYVHADDRADVQRRFEDWVRTGTGTLDGDFRVVSRGGQVREVLAHSCVERVGRRPLLFGVVVDVTERRSTMLALRRADERAALAARGAGLGTWELDLASGHAWWDEQMWRLRGLAPQPQAPTPLARLDIVHPDDRDTVRRQTADAEARHGPVGQEFRVVLPDGRVRWLASRSTVVMGADGAPQRRIGVNWDITDARAAQAARHEREIARRESEAKSKFLARMSHELRTPLNAVLGFTQLMLQDEAGRHGEALRRQWLQTIEAAGQHLLSLINDVLDLTSVEGGEIRLEQRRVPVAPLFAEMLPLVQRQAADRGVTLRIDVADADTSAWADPTRLRQVLLNLLSNAIKYNRPGGSALLRAVRQGPWVELSVADTGSGLNEQQQQHLFEPFNRLGVEAAGIEGTGIGLVIVKSLTERMGGSVVVDSAPGQGSVFTLRLPAADVEAAGDLAPPNGAPEAAAGRRARTAAVLYVEDNPVNALILQELVARRPDIVLTVAADGRAGIEQARRLRPDLILLDMQLPDIDGLEVMRRLRADPATSDIRCVAVSANVMPDEVARARAAGVHDYWSKPIDLQVVLAALDRLLQPGMPGR